MRGLWKLTWVELKLFLREPMGAFFTLIFPMMMLLCFGSIYGNKPSPHFGGFGMVDIAVPGYSAMVICMSGMFLLTIRIASYREQGVLRRLRPTPLRPHAVLAAQVLALFGMAALGMTALLVTGKLLYHMRVVGDPLSVAAALTLSTLSFLALGFVLAGIVPTTRTALATVMALFYPMIFLSGATIPREDLPETIRRVSQFFPLTHVVNLLRGIWIGDPWGHHLLEVGVLVGMIVVGVAITAKTFRWE
jgi:ABC-2 type transport system permease protein